VASFLPSYCAKVVYTLYIVPTGLGVLAGLLSIDIMSLTGQSVNRRMKDANFVNTN